VSRSVSWVHQILACAFALAVGSIFVPLVGDGSAVAASPGRVELVELRTEQSKTFRNGNGTFTASVFAEPVHFRNGSGRWQEISSRLVAADSGGFAFRNEANDFRVLFKPELEGEYARFVADGDAFSLRAVGAARATARAARDDGRLTYDGAYPGVDLEYELAPSGVKETLVLRDANAPSRYRFELEGPEGLPVEVERLRDGSWAFHTPRRAEPAFVLAAPTIVDTPGGRLAGGPAGTREATGRPVADPRLDLKVTRAGASFAVELSFDPRWLRDPARRFPVLLDPTILIQGTSQYGNFDFNCPTCTPLVDDRVRIGSSATEIWRPALQFNLAAVPAGATVTDARLGLYYDGKCVMACAPSSHQLDLHRMTAAWSTSTTTAGVAYAAAPSATTLFTTIADADVQWLTWDVTSLVNAWRGGTYPNYGVLLRRNPDPLSANGPTTPSGRYTEEATLKPKLDVTYSGDAVELFPITSTHSNGADLEWTRYVGTSGAPFDKYEVHRSATAGFAASASTLVATIRDRDVTRYRDTTAAPSKTFHYKVVANTSPSVERSAALNGTGNAAKTLQPRPETGKATSVAFDGSAPSCVNDGADDDLWLAADTTAVRRSLLAFDLRDLPPTANVTAARLSLWRPFNAGFSGAVVDVHRVTGAWDEGTGISSCTGDGATWQETQAGIPWSADGGDYDPAVVRTVTTSSSGDWDNYFIEGLVAQWVRGDVPNHGVVLKLRDETQAAGRRFRYYSDDFAVAPTLRPKLYLVYTDGSAAIAPTVSMVAPAPAEPVSGASVLLRAAASDDGRVAKVEFLVDGAVVGTDTAGPYELAWSSTAATNAAHDFSARATDDAGNVTTSSAVSATVENRAAPTTAVTAPAPNATVAGNATVSANGAAASGLAVSKVEFYVDDLRFAEDATAPYSATLNTLDAAQPSYNGAHTLSTKVYDSAGRVTSSTGVAVTVANSPATKYKAGFASTEPPLAVYYDPATSPQEQSGFDVTVTNTSTTTWSASSITLRSRWYSADATPTVVDGPAVGLGSNLGAGASRVVRVLVDPPVLPEGVDKSKYTLRFDLFDSAAGGGWFADKGNKPLEHPIIVNKVLKTALGLERYYHNVGEELGVGMHSVVNVANGNSIVRWTPFQAPGRGLSTVVDLTYNALEKKCDCPAGNNWSLAISSLTRFGNPIEIHPNKADEIGGRSNKYIEITDADGTTHRFTSTDGITYREPAGVHLYLRRYSTTDATRKWALTRPDKTTFFYNADGYPTSVEDRNGNRITFTLQQTPPAEDPGGPKFRVTTVTDAGGRAFTLTYWSKAEAKKAHIRGKVKRIADHTGSALDFDYYEDGNLLRLTQRGGTNADGSFLADRSFVFTYTDSPGNGPAIPLAADRVNPDPRTPSQSTRLYSVRDPRGNETLFSYLGSGYGNDRWKIASRTNRAGAVTSFAYDIVARKTTVTEPLSRVSAYAYDVEGKPTAITNPKNETSTIAWDSDRHLSKVTEANGAYREYVHDDNGLPTSERVLTDRKDPSTTADDVVSHTTYEYTYQAVDGSDTASTWRAGRTIPHLSLLAKRTDPNGNATASPTDDHQWLFGYDAAGNQTTVTDPEGFVTTTTYNADGTVATVRDALGHVTTVAAYDANGLPTEVRDAKNQVTRLTYDADGLVRSIQDPLHAADSHPDERVYKHVLEYDSFHRPGRQSQPKSTRFEPGVLIWSSVAYDENDNMVAEHEADYAGAATGAKTTSTYDAMDRPALVTGPDRSADPAGERTRFEYDLAGRTTRVTSPKGVMTPAADDFVEQYEYDVLDRVTTEVRLDGAGGALRRHYCYDLAGDLRWVTEPKAGLAQPPATCSGTPPTHTTRLAYDDAHRLVTETDGLGQSRTTGYDPNGDVLTEADQAGAVVTRTLNERGEVVKVVEPFERDGSGNVLRSLTSRIEYDGVGNVKREITPRGWDASADKQTFTRYVTDYAYDELDRLVRVDLPVGGAEARTHVHRGYDAAGNLTMISVPVENADPAVVPADKKTTFDHFDLGWIKSSNDPANPIVHYDYTAFGSQSSRTPQRRGAPTPDVGQRVLSEYYPDGLLKRTTDRNGAGQSEYSYDANDNLTKANESRGVVSNAETGLDVESTYDAFDRPSKVRYQRRGTPNWTFTTYDYDANGNVLTRVDNGEETPAGALVTDGIRQVFTYGQADDLDSVHDHGRDSGSADDLRASWTYWPTGWTKKQTIERSDAGGAWTTSQTTDWSHFANGSLRTLVTKNGAGGMLEQHTLGYVAEDGLYANGNRTSDVFRLVGPDQGQPCRAADCTHTYTYDARDRVTHETRLRGGSTNVTRFDLDPAGNVTVEYLNGVERRSLAYVGNQLTSITAGSTVRKLHYDSEGDLDCITNGSGTATDCNAPEGATPSSALIEDFAYDYLDRIAGYRKYASGAMTDSADYVSDALNRVSSQKESHGGVARTSLFTYAGTSPDLTNERHETGAGAFLRTKSYSYGAPGERVAMTVADASTTARSTFARNPHGDTSLVVGGATADAQYAYSPYGDEDQQLTKGDPASTDPTSAYRYSSKRYDSGSSTIDMGARRFSTDLTRFLQRDEYEDGRADGDLAVEGQTQNRYALAAGNPVGFIELDGHVSVPADGGSPYPPVNNLGKKPSYYHFKMPRLRGYGFVRGGIFIQTCRIKLRAFPDLRGDCRRPGNHGFDPYAPPDRYRGLFRLDYERGAGLVRMNPTCAAETTKCWDAYQICNADKFICKHTPTALLVRSKLKIRSDGRRLGIELDAHDSAKFRIPGPVPAAKVGFALAPQSGRRFIARAGGDGFPSFELYHWKRTGGILNYRTLCRWNGSQPLAALPPWPNKIYC
jgi:RHS repeat-associated protein